MLGEWCRTWVVEKADFYGTAQGLNPNSHQWNVSGAGGGLGGVSRRGRGGDRIPVRGEPRRFGGQAGAGAEAEALISSDTSSPNRGSPGLEAGMGDSVSTVDVEREVASTSRLNSHGAVRL
jgi:hypothetical protein